MTYAEAQAALAETPAGAVALTMKVGDRFIRPAGDVVTIWMTWRPGTAQEEAYWNAQKRPLEAGHNTQIGVTSREGGTERVDVADLEDWKRVPSGGCATFKRYYHDKGPDACDRRRFTLVWEEPDGVFRPEPSKLEDGPVGYRRAQEFHADPKIQTRTLERQGHTVTDCEGPSPYEIAAASRKTKRDPLASLRQLAAAQEAALQAGHGASYRGRVRTRKASP